MTTRPRSIFTNLPKLQPRWPGLGVNLNTSFCPGWKLSSGIRLKQCGGSFAIFLFMVFYSRLTPSPRQQWQILSFVNREQHSGRQDYRYHRPYSAASSCTLAEWRAVAF